MNIPENLCAMCKSVSMTKNADGTVSVSVTAFGDAAEQVCKTIIGSIDASYKVVSVTEDPPYSSITCTSDKNKDTRVTVKKAGIFKTIPTEVYELHKRGLFFKSIVPNTYSPESGRYIKQSEDIYGAVGWTVSEILTSIGANVSIPSSLNYHVYEMSITKGTPLVSILRSLFPSPGITIANYNNKLYVNLPTAGSAVDSTVDSLLSGGICDIKTINVSENTTQYAYKVVGLQGEPKNVQSDTETGEDSEGGSTMKITFNLAGGVFGITERSTVISDISNTIIAKYYNGSANIPSVEGD